MSYCCAQCGAPVEIIPGQEIKFSCEHHGAGIIAQVEANCKGRGGVKI